MNADMNPRFPKNYHIIVYLFINIENISFNGRIGKKSHYLVFKYIFVIGIINLFLSDFNPNNCDNQINIRIICYT